MHTTKDMPSAPSLPAICIADDKALCDLVHEAASIQLVLTSAEAKQQAAIEAAKKAFVDATREQSQRIAAIFAAIETYAATHRDRLFPERKGKRSKTYAILQHKLQYRSSDSVEAPSDAVDLVKRLMDAAKLHLEGAPEGHKWNGLTLADIESNLQRLIRQPDPEFNKEALKSLNADLLEVLRLNGIRIKTTEVFKLAFTFSPEAAYE